MGKVANIVNNINACFVDYGDRLPCYYSLDDNDIIYADGREHTKLRIGDEIVVQISRDAVKTKNPVGSSELTLRGDYCVAVSYTHLDVYKRQLQRFDPQEYVNALFADFDEDRSEIDMLIGDDM